MLEEKMNEIIAKSKRKYEELEDKIEQRLHNER